MGTNRFRWPSTAASLLLFLSLSAAVRAKTDPACRSEWLPLDTGNYWVYRYDTRSSTGGHLTVRGLGPYELNGQVWCQIESNNSNYFLGVDDKGRILQRTLATPTEQFILDPNSNLYISVSTSTVQLRHQQAFTNP